MQETEFKNANRHATKVYGDVDGVTIYRTYNRYTETCKFFKFEQQKLVKFQEGYCRDTGRLLQR
jgi:hypothetical protein